MPSDPVILGGVALALSYSAYVAEVYRAGIRSVHPSQRAAALAVGLTEAQALRHVILPQAVRRVVPPLLNDFISLQKDVALVAILGAAGGVPRRADRRVVELQLHAAGGRGAAVPVRDGAARAGRRPHAAERHVTAVLELQGVTKAYGDVEVLRGIDLQVPEHQAVALIGASGSGKSTLLRCVDLLEEIDDGDVLLDGEVITDPAVEPVAVRRRLGMVFQAFNLFPHMTVLENVMLGPGPRARRGRGRGARARARAAGALRSRRPRGRVARQPVRRPAAARGDRPRAGDRAARAAARRGHERARPRAGRRGARASCATSRPTA